MFITLQAVRYMASPGAGAVWTLPDKLYGDDGPEGKALFKHYDGSSWHGADSYLILGVFTALQRYLPLLTFVLGVGLGYVAAQHVQGRGGLAACLPPRLAALAAVRPGLLISRARSPVKTSAALTVKLQ
jgi:hypothetical protein